MDSVGHGLDRLVVLEGEDQSEHQSGGAALAIYTKDQAALPPAQQTQEGAQFRNGLVKEPGEARTLYLNQACSELASAKLRPYRVCSALGRLKIMKEPMAAHGEAG